MPNDGGLMIGEHDHVLDIIRNHSNVQHDLSTTPTLSELHF